MFWVEEFRPREFKDVIGLPKEIESAVGSNELIHLLLVGSPGTGKTTTAKIIIDKTGADELILNASNDRGIGIIREKVKSFAMTASSNGKKKIIFLDEADGLTGDAQDSLKNLMETYSSNCTFILTANRINKITDALQSRCSIFKFELPKKDEILNRLKYITKTKNLLISDDLLAKLVTKYYPDIRKCVSVLQELSFLNKEITEMDIRKTELLVADIFKKLKESPSFGVVRQFVLDANVDYANLIIEMYKYVLENKEIFGTNAIKLLMRIKDTNRFLNSCISQEIEVEVLLYSIMQDLKGA